MDSLKLARKAYNAARLTFVYGRYILGGKNHFKVSLPDRIKANVRGFTADQWALYDLDTKKSKEYLSEFDWYKSRYINEPFDQMLNNKVITTEVLGSYIKFPEIYAIRNNGAPCLHDGVGTPLDEDGLIALCKEKKAVVIKPIDRGKGLGVHIIDAENEAWKIDGISAEEASVRKLFKGNQWYLSEKIRQHEYADKLYPLTINTIRIITMQDKDNQQADVFFAVQRMGTSKTIPVDNGSQGGIVCKIDLETGCLSEGRTLHSKTVYKEHPDTGTVLSEMKVPNWDSIREKVLGIARAFPYIHFIAWDIVVMEDGEPCVIEANTSSGVNIIQLWGAQRNDRLGAFYKQHRVIKK